MTLPAPDPSLHSIQPDEAFPALLRYLATPACRGLQIMTTVDGRIVLRLQQRSSTMEIRWRPGRRDAQGVPLGEGSVVFRGVDPPFRRRVLDRLDMVLADGPAPLFRPHYQDIVEVSPEAQALDPLLAPLMKPGLTRCGDAVYKDLSPLPGGVAIRFDARPGVMSFTLTEANVEPEAPEPILTRLGPLVLRLPGFPDVSHLAHRLAAYLGYALNLCLPQRARLARTSEIHPASGTRNPVQDPPCPREAFLQESYADEAEVFRTLLCARGAIKISVNAERECLRCVVAAESPGHGVGASPWASPLPPGALERLHATDPEEAHVIQGDPEMSFERLLRTSVDSSPPGLLVIFHSCLSKLVGEQVPHSLELLDARLKDVPTICLDGSVAALHNYAPLWEQLIEAIAEPAGKSPSPTVTLVGYGSGEGQVAREIEDLLRCVDVGVMQWLVPRFDLSLLRQLDAAWAHVASPARLVRDGPLPAISQRVRPVIELPAPCGMEGTRRWLQAVRTACGLPPINTSRVDEVAETLAPAWRALQAEAKTRGIGVVMDEIDLASPETRTRWGVPWLELFEEMGFKMTFVILSRTQDVSSRRRAIKTAFPFLGNPGKHRLVLLPHVSHLTGVLADSSFELVYTEIHRDTRVTRAGKVPISVRDIEPGFHGALRSLDRLLALARTPFYRRYHPGSSWRSAP